MVGLARSEGEGRAMPWLQASVGSQWAEERVVSQGSGSQSVLEPGFGRCRPGGKGVQSRGEDRDWTWGRLRRARVAVAREEAGKPGGWGPLPLGAVRT